MAMIVGQTCSYIALAFGIFFFLFAVKYYFAILIALFSGRINERTDGNFNRVNDGGTPNLNNGLLGLFRRHQNGNGTDNQLNANYKRDVGQEEPFISIQLPFYNEKNVAKRIIQACIEIDYPNYEVIVADDSRDETVKILKELNKRRKGPTIKFVHRKNRTGFKGGALQKAVEYMDPRTKYVVVFDADFMPPPDIIERFLVYFEGQNGNGDHENGHRKNSDDMLEKVDEWFERRRIGVVQGYQLHYLNKNENWITKGVRAEYSGGYMIERVAEEFFGSMKMITGSVFMIRADILRRLGWTHSITEDWDLTLRMYLEGYKVLYTPLIQAPAEIPTTIRALARQRMRWAEGHTFAVKKYFWGVLRSPNISVREKLEFLYFSPYYLQSFFFLIGTLFWFAAELLGQHPYFWTATFGWYLILSNLFSLPLMGLSGLYLEQTAREDYTGIFSFIVLSYLLTPFQAYAAIKGLFERDEGGWVRTLKTGHITDRILQVRLRRLFNWILPKREAPPRIQRNEEDRRSNRSPAMALILLILMTSLIVWVTAAAMSKSDVGVISTALSLEFIDQAALVNGIETNRMLTHHDYTSLGPLYTDNIEIKNSGWHNAWDFYLCGPLDSDYDMKGRIDVNLHLYAYIDCDAKIRIRIIDVDEDGRLKTRITETYEVELGNESPTQPVLLKMENSKVKKFETGHSILVEIWLKNNDGDRNATAYYLDYDSSNKHSRIEFSGMVMPENLTPLIAIAPIITIIIHKTKRGLKRDGSQD
jgi:cellulose synthase/poly-beta-1,6-N-acetylglucosamine synthase-like glycosyltransferase